jgi:hypothetical protein
MQFISMPFIVLLVLLSIPGSVNAGHQDDYMSLVTSQYGDHSCSPNDQGITFQDIRDPALNAFVVPKNKRLAITDVFIAFNEGKLAANDSVTITLGRAHYPVDPDEFAQFVTNVHLDEYGSGFLMVPMHTGFTLDAGMILCAWWTVHVPNEDHIPTPTIPKIQPKIHIFGTLIAAPQPTK